METAGQQDLEKSKLQKVLDCVMLCFSGFGEIKTSERHSVLSSSDFASDRLGTETRTDRAPLPFLCCLWSCLLPPLSFLVLVQSNVSRASADCPCSMFTQFTLGIQSYLLRRHLDPQNPHKSVSVFTKCSTYTVYYISLDHRSLAQVKRWAILAGFL